MSISGEILGKLSGSRSTRPSLDALLAAFDRELENFESLVLPGPDARPRTPFDSPNVPTDRLSTANMSARQLASVLPIMLPLIARMRAGAKLYDGRFQPTHCEATIEFVAQLEAVARAAGARDIGYLEVPRNAIFQGKGIPHPHAIVFTVEMDGEKLATAPSYEAFREVARGYKNLATIGNKLAGLLRKNGFAAYPGTALGGLSDYTYLAERAGLGAVGYHGLLISPREGARLRINTIYTSITNLPVDRENEHLWVRDFCAACQKCVRECPVDAIFTQPRPRGDDGRQCINHAACRDYFNQHFGCGVCLARCPFSVAGYEKVLAGFRRKSQTLRLDLHET